MVKLVRTLYLCSFLWNGTTKDSLILMDYLYLTHQKRSYGPYGEYIDTGVIEHWENEVEVLKNDQDALNEFYRQFPRTEEARFQR